MNADDRTCTPPDAPAACAAPADAPSACAAPAAAPPTCASSAAAPPTCASSADAPAAFAAPTVAALACASSADAPATYVSSADAPPTCAAPAAAAPRPTPWIGLFVAAAALVLFILFFDAVSTVLLGVMAAAVVASTLNPLLRHVPGPRGSSAALLGLGLIATVLAVLLALSWPLAGPISRQVESWPQTRVKVNEYLQSWSNQLGLAEAPTMEKFAGSIGRFFAGEGGQRLFSRSADVSLAIFIWLAFIFIGSIFFLADPHDRLLSPALEVVPPGWRGRVQTILDELGPKYRRWVSGTFLSMCIVFTASATGYAIIGLDLALPLALLAGLCEIVPTVGPAVACIIATLFAAATAPPGYSGRQVVGVLSVYVVIQSIEAYVILPMIMRGAVKIHPAVTLFTVVLWGKIFGVPGLMLAIPINLTLASVVEHLYVKPRQRRQMQMASGQG